MSPVESRYIAAGSLPIGIEESNLIPELWFLPQLREWRAFRLPGDPSQESTADGKYLPPDVQQRLLKAPKLSQLSRLFRARWANLGFMVTGDALATVRVYLLPDDVQRATVDRAVPALRKARQSVLSGLEYSEDSWNGRHPLSNGHGHQVPVPLGGPGPSEDLSLLQLFNTIPSPDPTPEEVFDPLSQDAMYNLLESKVPGLKTELYPYQRRSAALMLQKEAQPGRILDPRLRQVHDQEGKNWYYDRVSGTVFSDPRHYDGISGGILAEEMGSGKTIICLSLILASRDIPGKVPELYGCAPPPTRPKLASLLDMAASCATRQAAPWRAHLCSRGSETWEYRECIKAIERNPGYYYEPGPEPRRGGRRPDHHERLPRKKIYLSSATLVVVPTNLVAQWRQEIQKHTEDLKVLTIIKHDGIPHHKTLLDYDMILFAQSRFEALAHTYESGPLGRLHFKRCIVDEGHKLGNSRMGNRSNLLAGLEQLRFDSRWVVTGTPSHGLFGVDNNDKTSGTTTPSDVAASENQTNGVDISKSSNQMEKKDLERIGSMASLFLRVRPWANRTSEAGDTPADWDTYLMLPRHRKGAHGRWDSLKATLHSLMLRHQLHEIGELLPPVNEKVVILRGSYQDQLSMNIFSMMIIFNSVQSQRTDMDYFFHPKQRRSLLQIVHNLKQSSFFGGSFFTSEEIAKSVETAEEFLRKKEIVIDSTDEKLLRAAIDFGHTAIANSLRNLSNQFHEMPVCVENFPGGAGRAWSLGNEENADGCDVFCTSASLLLALQRLVYNTAGEPEKFNALLNGGFVQEGMLEKQKLLDDQHPQATRAPKEAQSQTLAGNTKLGGDSAHKSRTHGVNGIKPMTTSVHAETILGPLASTCITATVSAKMSYLLDQLVKHQEEEKIIVFYENENIAWYLASMLDVVSL
jgi:hypothetical protein